MDTGLLHTELTRKGLVTLSERGILRFENAAGRHIGVVRGTVWVTQHGDARDHVLRAGESFRFDHDGRALAVALSGPAGLVLEEGLVPVPAADDSGLPGARQVIDATYEAWLARQDYYEREARRMRAQAFVAFFGGIGRSLRAVAGRFGRALSETLLVQRTGFELRALSDHLLRDIGLRRDQIDCVARRAPC